MNSQGWNDDEPNIIIDTEYTPNTLEDEKKCVLSILEGNDNLFIYYELDNILSHGSNELKNNKDIFMTIAKANRLSSCLLKYVSETLKDDKEFILAAVTNDGKSLEFASDRLMNDVEVILVAVTNYGEVLKIVPHNLKNKDVVLAAITKNGIALEYVPEDLKNEELCSIAVAENGFALKFVPEHFKNKELVLTAVKNNGGALNFATNMLKKDKDIVYAAVTQCGNVLEFVDDSFKNDKDLAIIAVSCWNDSYYFDLSIKYVSDDLKKDEDVISTAVKHNGYSLYYVSNDVIRRKPHVIVDAIYRSGINVLSCVPYDDCTVEKVFIEEEEVDYDYLFKYKKNYDMYRHTYHNFYIHIKENIQAYENFLLFLYGVCIPKSQSITRKLRNHGPYHSINFLKLIINYTGIINGNNYCVYKSVLKQVNLLLC